MDKVLSVLLVDDEPSVRGSLKLILEAMGFKVTACTNPIEGLAALKESSFDVILSDLKMPQMSGVDFLALIRTSGSNIPFILMSGHATKNDIDKARAYGIKTFLPKPFSPNELLFELENLDIGVTAEEIRQQIASAA